jgi:hypothetical protein
LIHLFQNDPQITIQSHSIYNPLIFSIFVNVLKVLFLTFRVAVFKDLPNHRVSPTQEIRRSAESKNLDQRTKAVSHIFPAMSRTVPAYDHRTVSRTSLLSITKMIAAEKKTALDRTEKRSKEGMICWLCEVALELADSSISAPPLDLKTIEPDPTIEGKESENDFDLASFGVDEDPRKEEDALFRSFP